MNKISSYDHWQAFNIKSLNDDRGSLSFIEYDKEIPFYIKRMYYLYNVPNHSIRGAHGHIELEQIMICISGSCKVVLDNGKIREDFYLNRPDIGLYIPAGTWRELFDFSCDAVCIVLASDVYKESDYIRDYDSFLKYIAAKTIE